MLCQEEFHPFQILFIPGIYCHLLDQELLSFPLLSSPINQIYYFMFIFFLFTSGVFWKSIAMSFYTTCCIPRSVEASSINPRYLPNDFRINPKMLPNEPISVNNGISCIGSFVLEGFTDFLGFRIFHLGVVAGGVSRRLEVGRQEAHAYASGRERAS
jgi:hypothetical protein